MIRGIASKIGISYEKVRMIIKDDLKYWKICVWWIPHTLTTEQKQKRIDMSTRNLARFNEEENFLKILINYLEIELNFTNNLLI